MDETGGYQQNKFVAEFHDFVPAHGLSWDAEFYARLSQEAQGPVLELASGTGRLIIPIARAGVETTGLELSKEMLALARQKVSNEPGEVQDKVRLVHGDMRKFELGQDMAGFLGSLLISSIFIDALSGGPRPDCLVVVDEFWQYTTSAFSEILALSRGLDLGWILAHQFQNQLQDDTRSAIAGNAGTVVCGRVDEDDAAAMARRMVPFSDERALRNLPDFEFAAWMSPGGMPLTPSPLGSSGPRPGVRSGRRRRGEKAGTAWGYCGKRWRKRSGGVEACSLLGQRKKSSRNKQWRLRGRVAAALVRNLKSQIRNDARNCSEI